MTTFAEESDGRGCPHCGQPLQKGTWKCGGCGRSCLGMLLASSGLNSGASSQSHASVEALMPGSIAELTRASKAVAAVLGEYRNSLEPRLVRWASRHSKRLCSSMVGLIRDYEENQFGEIAELAAAVECFRYVGMRLTQVQYQHHLWMQASQLSLEISQSIREARLLSEKSADTELPKWPIFIPLLQSCDMPSLIELPVISEPVADGGILRSIGEGLVAGLVGGLMGSRHAAENLAHKFTHNRQHAASDEKERAFRKVRKSIRECADRSESQLLAWSQRLFIGMIAWTWREYVARVSEAATVGTITPDEPRWIAIAEGSVGGEVASLAAVLRQGGGYFGDSTLPRHLIHESFASLDLAVAHGGALQDEIHRRYGLLAGKEAVKLEQELCSFGVSHGLAEDVCSIAQLLRQGALSRQSALDSIYVLLDQHAKGPCDIVCEGAVSLSAELTGENAQVAYDWHFGKLRERLQKRGHDEAV